MIGLKLNQRHFNMYFFVSTAAAMIVTFFIIIVTVEPILLHGNVHAFDAWSYAMFTTFSMSSSLVFLVMYSYFLLSIRIRFRLLNVVLHDAIAPSNGLVARPSKLLLYNQRTSEAIKSLNRLIILHDQLTTSVDIINRCFSFKVSPKPFRLHQLQIFIPIIIIHLLHR